MSKLLLFTTVFLCSALLSQAQVSKGQFFLGGDIRMGGTRSEIDNTPNRKIADYFFQPQIGYAFRDNRVMGLLLLYRTNNDNGTAMPYNIRQYAAGIFYRAYLTLPKSFFLFGQGQALYKYSKEDYDIGPPRSRIWTFNDYTASLHPGVGYAVKKRFHLELAVNELVSFTYGTSRKLDVEPGRTTEQKATTWTLQSDIHPKGGLIFAFRFLLGK